MGFQIINIIFGMKVRQARMDADLTLSEFAGLCDLSPSYVTEIEKGRKYPRTDKIVRMAAVLGKDYDDLVSIKLPPSLTYLESTLSSSVVQRFPFEEFGFEAGDLVNLLTRKPDKASALLHGVLDVARHYNLREEEFLRAALRSYQEIHENYFPDLEESAGRFIAEFGQKYPLIEETRLSWPRWKRSCATSMGTRLMTRPWQTQPNYRGTVLYLSPERNLDFTSTMPSIPAR